MTRGTTRQQLAWFALALLVATGTLVAAGLSEARPTQAGAVATGTGAG
jgi:hypothetical protein